jgi:DnaJ like chaperone protein
MAWWGTLLGGTLGFMFGGPLGALLGAALGRNFDVGIKLSDQHAFTPGDTERVQTAFFTATFSVMGHVAKADGIVSNDEIASARNIMAQMQLDARQRDAAIRLFNEGKQSGFPLDEVLKQFKHECHGRRNLIQMFIEIQVATVLADGQIHPAEKKLLFHIADVLGFSHQQIEQFFHFATGGRSQQSSGSALKEAYALLGVSATDDDSTIKKAYRRLMNQHHPDKLVAKGLPEEMMKLATEKSQQIQIAYDLIKKNRH